MRLIATEDRRGQIARQLLDKGIVRVGDLSRSFCVSTETIRKDLIALEKQGLAKKSHGGAIVTNEILDISLSTEGKWSIAHKAMEFIPEGCTIMLDGGPLCMLLAQHLPEQFGITIITASPTLSISTTKKGIRTILVGGEISQKEDCATGIWAQLCIEKVKADACFLTTTGFSGRHGPCADSFSVGHVKRMMMKTSKKVYIMSEGLQSIESSLLEYAAWSDVDALIIDSSATTDMLNELNGRVSVVLA